MSRYYEGFGTTGLRWPEPTELTVTAETSRGTFMMMDTYDAAWTKLGAGTWAACTLICEHVARLQMAWNCPIFQIPNRFLNQLLPGLSFDPARDDDSLCLDDLDDDEWHRSRDFSWWRYPAVDLRFELPARPQNNLAQMVVVPQLLRDLASVALADEQRLKGLSAEARHVYTALNLTALNGFHVAMTAAYVRGRLQHLPALWHPSRLGAWPDDPWQDVHRVQADRYKTHPCLKESKSRVVEFQLLGLAAVVAALWAHPDRNEWFEPVGPAGGLRKDGEEYFLKNRLRETWRVTALPRSALRFMVPDGSGMALECHIGLTDNGINPGLYMAPTDVKGLALRLTGHEQHFNDQRKKTSILAAQHAVEQLLDLCGYTGHFTLRVHRQLKREDADGQPAVRIGAVAGRTVTLLIRPKPDQLPLEYSLLPPPAVAVSDAVLRLQKALAAAAENGPAPSPAPTQESTVVAETAEEQAAPPAAPELQSPVPLATLPAVPPAATDVPTPASVPLGSLLARAQACQQRRQARHTQMAQLETAAAQFQAESARLQAQADQLLQTAMTLLEEDEQDEEAKRADELLQQLAAFADASSLTKG